MIRTRPIIPVASTLLLAILAGSAQSAEFTIPSAATPTLQFALEAPTSPVQSGDTIILTDAGFYLSTYTVSTTNLTIRAAPGQSVVIDGLGLGSVFTLGASGSGLTLEGLTIQGGQAPDGGGIYCDGADITLIDCVIRDNHADDDGGGMVIFDGDGVVTGCTFMDNTLNLPNASDNGGAIHIGSHATLDISASTFTGNVANNYGGAIYFNDTLGTITDCVFDANSALRGGALGFISGGRGTVTDCVISNNHSGQYGGGVASNGAWPDLVRCQIVDNTADTTGGGVYVTGETTEELDMISCVIARNTAMSRGGGFDADTGPDSHLTNCTIVGNTVVSGTGGGIRSSGAGAGAVIYNCIVRANSPDQYPSAGSNIAYDSNIEGDLSNNTRIIDADPMFVDEINGDYRLLQGSPSIDAGNSSLFSGEAIPLDLDANPRVVTDLSSAQTGLPLLGLYIDQGAYEFQPEAAPACTADLNNDGMLNFFDVSTFLSAYSAGCP